MRILVRRVQLAFGLSGVHLQRPRRDEGVVVHGAVAGDVELDPMDLANGQGPDCGDPGHPPNEEPAEPGGGPGCWWRRRHDGEADALTRVARFVPDLREPVSGVTA